MQTQYHKLILPTDTNHRNTLYAGSLLRIALEAGYTASWKHAGPEANLVLRRVLNLECLKPIPVGTMIEINCAVLYQTKTYIVVGMYGAQLAANQGPWMEALMGFAQIDEDGRSTVFKNELPAVDQPVGVEWDRLQSRLKSLRSRSGKLWYTTID